MSKPVWVGNQYYADDLWLGAYERCFGVGHHRSKANIRGVGLRTHLTEAEAKAAVETYWTIPRLMKLRLTGK